jgi:hypothetical protein
VNERGPGSPVGTAKRSDRQGWGAVGQEVGGELGDTMRATRRLGTAMGDRGRMGEDAKAARPPVEANKVDDEVWRRRRGQEDRWRTGEPGRMGGAQRVTRADWRRRERAPQEVSALRESEQGMGGTGGT